ncbi:hypothetical protein [Reyranella sp.]|uniref:hypothetical protein n=1 Tax=Reyranella sp. TaxID=1929291 RepID=UPI004035CF2F
MPDFTMYQGDTKVLQVTVKTPAGVVVPITGTTIRWQLAESAEDAEPIIAKAVGAGITIVDGPAGRFDVAINPADTLALEGSYYHEAEVDDGGVISTVLTGAVTIKPALIKPE